MADAQQREDQAGGKRYEQDVDDRRLGLRAFFPVPAGPNGEPIPVVPLVHVRNFKERGPPIFHGLPQEDVMEWSH